MGKPASEWHGWVLTETVREPAIFGRKEDRKHRALHIGPLPGRKQIAIYLVDGCTGTPAGYFRDEESARLVMGFIDGIVDTLTKACEQREAAKGAR